VNVPSNSNKQKTDPDPLVRGTDPEHCKRINMIWFFDAQWFKNETHTDLMNSNLTVDAKSGIKISRVLHKWNIFK